MAELSSKALANFTAASSALVLTKSLRLIRNYRYYNDISDHTVSKEELVHKIREARQFAFTLHNLMTKNEPEEAPFFVSIAGGINDVLEEIHRKLLFFDADDIADIIPIIDEQRNFWSDFDKEDFYNPKLIQKLEHAVPETLLRIEKKCIGLPPVACV